MCRGGILVQGMCFLSATHSFDGKNLYRELKIGGRHITLLAIQTFVRKKVCRGTKHGLMTGKLLAIHSLMPKRVCRGMRNTPARLNDTTNHPNPARDTGFCAGKGVSLHETRPDDRNTASDTQFHAEKGVSLQGKVVGKERRLVNLGCREADLARGEDRWKQRWE